MNPSDIFSTELHKAGLTDVAVSLGYAVKLNVDIVLDTILSVSPQIEDIKTRVRKFAPTNIPILILGETGTGKELFATALHGERNPKTFVAVNCGAIPSELLESELFGSIRGAFTGALERKGLIEKAKDGTLFLDEIGDMPPLLQCKLLRVIQEKKFRRVGDTEEQKINFRLISATNHLDISDNKIFRPDLYYRLAGHVIKVPPLRERNLNDIQLISTKFAKTAAIAQKCYEHAQYSELKGNVRELLNLIEEYNILYL